jgi:hypothetical protein
VAIVRRVRRAVGIVCLAFGALAFGPPATAAVPAPRLLSTDPFAAGAQHETAVEPDSLSWGNTVVAVFQVGRFLDGGAAGIGWATSTDGGVTWASGILPGLTVHGTPPGPYTRVSDPVIAYDRVHGVWLASVLGLIDAPGGLDSEVATSRSADGVNWSPPVVTAPNRATFAHDKNWLVCDTGAASPFAGRCYTLWVDVTIDSALAVSVSTDGGLTWSRRPLILEDVDGTGWQPLVRPDGVLVVPYLGARAIESVRSTDGGATFSPRTVITPLFASNPNGVRAGPLPSAEIDAAGRVFVAWPDCRFRTACANADPTTPNEMVLVSSADGVRWTAPVRVPTGSAAGVDHLVPGLAVDATTQGPSARLALAYYTLTPARCSSACRIGASLVSSADAGRSWSAPVVLSTPTPVADVAQSNRGRFVGDYISTSFVGGGVAVPVFSAAFAPFDGRFHQGVFATAVPPLPAAPVSPALGRVTASAGRPRAGRRFVVSAAVAGTPAGTAASVSCVLRVGGVAVRPLVRRLARGRATCEWRIPPAAAGRRASGSLAVSSGGRMVRRTFSYLVLAATRS